MHGIFCAPLNFMKNSRPAGKILLVVGGLVLGVTGCTVREVGYVGTPAPAPAPAPGPDYVAGGDVAVGGEVMVEGAPPAPMAETIVASPGPGFIWVGGYWGWVGNRWSWQGGHWARPPHAGAIWVGPRYYTRGGRHVWVHGGWR